MTKIDIVMGGGNDNGVESSGGGGGANNRVRWFRCRGSSSGTGGGIDCVLLAVAMRVVVMWCNAGG